jgi:predicted DNA-binding protein
MRLLTPLRKCDTFNPMRLQQTSVRIPPNEMNRLAALAKEEGLQVSDLIRRAIREYLGRIK